jgi:hypothetical protein
VETSCRRSASTRNLAVGGIGSSSSSGLTSKNVFAYFNNAGHGNALRNAIAFRHT